MALSADFFDYVGRGVPYGPDDGTPRTVGFGRIAAFRTGNRAACAKPLYSSGKDD